jgi:hypothetical protein
VVLEVAELAELLAAVLTSEWFFTRMCAVVNLEEENILESATSFMV